MPLANVRGVNINYKVLGDHGPWVALSPGGRRDISGIELLAGEVAKNGHRVVIFDRRNCGASDVVSTARIRSTRFGPTISTSCSDNSARSLPLSAAAPPVAGPRCFLPCVTPRLFAASCHGA